MNIITVNQILTKRMPRSISRLKAILFVQFNIDCWLWNSILRKVRVNFWISKTMNVLKIYSAFTESYSILQKWAIRKLFRSQPVWNYTFHQECREANNIWRGGQIQHRTKKIFEVFLMIWIVKYSSQVFLTRTVYSQIFSTDQLPLSPAATPLSFIKTSC